MAETEFQRECKKAQLQYGMDAKAAHNRTSKCLGQVAYEELRPPRLPPLAKPTRMPAENGSYA